MKQSVLKSFYHNISDYLSGFTPFGLRGGFGKHDNRNNHHNFYEIFNHNSQYHKFLGNQKAVWFDMSQYGYLYEEVAELKLVIDTVAMMFSNMKVNIVDKDNNIIDDKEFTEFITNPNPLQSWNEFLFNFKQQELIYGNQFLYKNVASTLKKYPSTIMNLDPEYIRPELTGKYLNQIDMEGIIEKYIYDNDGTEQQVFANDVVMWSRMPSCNSDILGKSPIDSLKIPISNIKHAYEFRNVAMSKKGALGILSNEKKDAVGSMPLTTEERRRIETGYLQNYGKDRGQSPVMLSDTPVKWQATSYPIKDMLLFEEVEANLKLIAKAYGINMNILNEGATFDNVKQSLVMAYQNTIQPQADKFLQQFQKFINLDEKYYLKADYSHLPVMQSDKKMETDIMKMNISSITSVFQLPISESAKLQIIKDKFDFSEEVINEIKIDVDKQKKANDVLDLNVEVQNENSEAQARLRGSVGGVQGILSIQASVSTGNTSESSAIQTLIHIYGFDEATAKEVLGIQTNQ